VGYRGYGIPPPDSGGGSILAEAQFERHDPIEYKECKDRCFVLDLTDGRHASNEGSISDDEHFVT